MREWLLGFLFCSSRCGNFQANQEAGSEYLNPSMGAPRFIYSGYSLHSSTFRCSVAYRHKLKNSLAFFSCSPQDHPSALIMGSGTTVIYMKDAAIYDHAVAVNLAWVGLLSESRRVPQPSEQQGKILQASHTTGNPQSSTALPSQTKLLILQTSNWFESRPGF